MRQPLYWTPVEPDPGVGGTNQVADSPNPNVTGVSDFQSEGMEIEGVWNPNENWTFRLENTAEHPKCPEQRRSDQHCHSGE